MSDVEMKGNGVGPDDFKDFMHGVAVGPVMQSGHPIVMREFKSDAGENALIVAESGGSQKCE